MKKLFFSFLILSIASLAFADATPNLLWIEVDGDPSGRARTVVVTNDVLTFNGNIMSLDVTAGQTGSIISADSSWTNDGSRIFPLNHVTGAAVSVDTLSVDSLGIFGNNGGYQATLGASSLAGEFTDGTHIARLSGTVDGAGTAAGYFADGSSSLEIANDSYLLYQTGGSFVVDYNGAVFTPTTVIADYLGTYQVTIGDAGNTRAAIFTDGTRTVEIADGTWAVKAEGAVAITGVISADSTLGVSGDVTTYSNLNVNDGNISGDSISVDSLYLAGLNFPTNPTASGSVISYDSSNNTLTWGTIASSSSIWQEDGTKIFPTDSLIARPVSVDSLSVDSLLIVGGGAANSQILSGSTPLVFTPVDGEGLVHIQGKMSIDNSIGVSGDASFYSTLSVGGGASASTITGRATPLRLVPVDGSGTVVVQGALSVDGLTAISGDLHVGINNFNVDASTGSTSISSDLTVWGTLYGGTPLDIAGGCNISGDTHIGINDFVVLDSVGDVGIGIVPASVRLHVAKGGNNAYAEQYISSFNDDGSVYGTYLTLTKSDSDELGVLAETDDNDYLSQIQTYGVNSGSAYGTGSTILTIQDGAAGGTYIPCEMIMQTSTNAGVNTNQLFLDSDGQVGVGREPTQVFDVNGAATISGDVYAFEKVVHAKTLRLDDSTNVNFIYGGAGDAGSIDFRNNASGHMILTNSFGVLLNGSGNSGVNLASPLNTFNVNGIMSGDSIGFEPQAASPDVTTVAGPNLYAHSDGELRYFDGTDWSTVIYTGGPVGAGKVVQVVNFTSNDSLTGGVALPQDDTIPQNTEGYEVMAATITPTDAANRLLIEVEVQTGTANEIGVSAALFQDATANALAAVGNTTEANTMDKTSISHYMTAGTTNPTTFKVRIGATNTDTITFNGKSGARVFGGVSSSSITITEID